MTFSLGQVRWPEAYLFENPADTSIHTRGRLSPVLCCPGGNRQARRTMGRVNNDLR